MVEVDFSAAFTHIAFAELGIHPPAVEDLYRVPGLERLERKLIKVGWNTFFFDTSLTRRSWPEEFSDCEWCDPETGEVFEGFPPAFSPSRVRKAIVAHYPALKEAFGKGIGYRLMFLESEIMRRLLTVLHERNIVGLPLHDALVVPRSVGPAVATLMEEVAKEVIGLAIPAKVSTLRPLTSLQ